MNKSDNGVTTSSQVISKRDVLIVYRMRASKRYSRPWLARDAASMSKTRAVFNTPFALLLRVSSVRPYVNEPVPQ